MLPVSVVPVATLTVRERERAFTAAVFDVNMNTLMTDQSHPGLSAAGFHLGPPAQHAAALEPVWEPVRPSTAKPGGYAFSCTKGDLTARLS